MRPASGISAAPAAMLEMIKAADGNKNKILRGVGMVMTFDNQ
jgi:hypothetical protein